jgi:hypothetical protein
MSHGKYEIDVDIDGEDPSSHMDVEEASTDHATSHSHSQAVDASANVRSAVSKKKGRGFSSAGI